MIKILKNCACRSYFLRLSLRSDTYFNDTSEQREVLALLL